MNFKEHNAEVKKIWKSFDEGNPIRMPMIIGVGSRFYMLNEKLNTKKISYQQYMSDPDIMFEVQAEFDRYKRFHIVADHMMGYPEEEGGWETGIDFQNCFEAAWFGSEIKYPENDCPYPAHLLNDDNREMLFEKGIPDPFEGWCGRARDYYERFLEKQREYVLDGYPVSKIAVNYVHTDGPFTVACDLLGPSEACILLCEDPDYMHQLLNYITDSVINRVKAWRKYLGQPELSAFYPFADDSIMLLSNDMYKEFILPYHKKLVKSLSTMTEPGIIHLCGDSTRHFETIKNELNVKTFDTGYPVKHGELVKQLGPDVQIQGGPTADLLRLGTPEEVKKEAKRIIDEVKPYTKKFILREGNNTAPGTPLENIAALYEAAKLYGRFE